MSTSSLTCGDHMTSHIPLLFLPLLFPWQQYTDGLPFLGVFLSSQGNLGILGVLFTSLGKWELVNFQAKIIQALSLSVGSPLNTKPFLFPFLYTNKPAKRCFKRL